MTQTYRTKKEKGNNPKIKQYRKNKKNINTKILKEVEEWEEKRSK